MKILAKVLLSSVFVVLPAVCCSQDDFGLDKDCGFAPALKGFTVETSVWINNKLIDVASPQIVEMLEDGQNCLNVNLIGLKTSVKSLHTQMGWNADSNLGLRNDIHDLEDKLKQTKSDLSTAETKIEDLEASLHLMGLRLAMAEDEIKWITPKAPARKPKTPASKPTPGFIPDTPATTPHPASKPKAPVNKPTQQTAPQGNPWDKPTPAAKEGTH